MTCYIDAECLDEDCNKGPDGEFLFPVKHLCKQRAVIQLKKLMARNSLRSIALMCIPLSGCFRVPFLGHNSVNNGNTT